MLSAGSLVSEVQWKGDREVESGHANKWKLRKEKMKSVEKQRGGYARLRDADQTMVETKRMVARWAWDLWGLGSFSANPQVKRADTRDSQRDNFVKP